LETRPGLIFQNVKFRPGLIFQMLEIALASTILIGAEHAAGAASVAQGTPDAPIKEYADLLVTLGEDALRQRRLVAPLPCLAHWVAGGDRVVVAVSKAGSAARLERGDVLLRIGERQLGGPGDDRWETAMRALRPGQSSFAVEIGKRGKRVRLVLPCEADEAVRLRQADLAMWTAVTQRDWTACVKHGEEALAVFGSAISPPLMVMTQCKTASSMPDARLTATLASALLAEMVANPGPQPDLREQLLLALRQLDAMHEAGGEDYATGLRAEMARFGVDPNER
jgi:hypothetical protein